MMVYKVLEVSPVDEFSLEKALNEWTAEGWIFERLEFVQQPGVRRPVLAFLFMIKKIDEEETSD